MAIGVGLLTLVPPLITALLYDDAYSSRDPTLAQLLVACLSGVTLGSALAGVARSLYAQLVSSRFSAELTLFLNRRLLYLPLSFVEQRRTGELVSRAGDLQRAVSFVTGAIQSVALNAFYVVVVPPVLFFVEWRLALLSLLAYPVTLLIGYLASSRQRQISRRMLDRGADTGSVLFEALSNLRTVKGLVAEEEILEELTTRALLTQDLQRQSMLLAATVGTANAVVRAVAGLVYLSVAWSLLTRGEMTLGTFMAFSGYLGYMTSPVSELTSTITSLQQTAVSLGRLFEYVDAPSEESLHLHTAGSDVKPTVPESAELTLTDISFRYGTGPVLLSDVSMRLTSGVTALVGPSGAGKSSIVRLLLRFSEPDSGAIHLNGVDIRRQPLGFVRSHFAVVSQELGLIRGSVRDNLTLGSGDVADQPLWDALMIVGLAESIRALPDGLDAVLAEAASSLSGGQRQRLAIARALVRNAPILVLDEATSSLDPAAEQELIRRIIDSQRSTLILVITHRLETIRDLARVYFLDASRIIGGESEARLRESSAEYLAFCAATQRSSWSQSPATRTLSRPVDTREML
jgi:ABC-type bacteriocin/lantibiotic exporter with double-glycine peptidase domain